MGLIACEDCILTFVYKYQPENTTVFDNHPLDRPDDCPQSTRFRVQEDWTSQSEHEWWTLDPQLPLRIIRSPCFRYRPGSSHHLPRCEISNSVQDFFLSYTTVLYTTTRKVGLLLRPFFAHYCGSQPGGTGPHCCNGSDRHS